MRRIAPPAIAAAAALAAAAAMLPGCDSGSAEGPPSIQIGEAVCDQCNMIISDERWATATVVQGPRGPEPRLFDDYNCQVNYEAEHTDDEILERWSHDGASGAWFKSEEGSYLISPSLRTPMGSNAMGFETRQAALDAQAVHGGDVVAFESAWERLGPGWKAPDEDG